jgi:hypothetical protein
MLDRPIPRFPGFALVVALIAPPAFAASTGPCQCAAPPASVLEGRLAYWQQRLKLSEWKISIVMSHASDLKPNTLGNIHWDTPSKTAVIRVLDAAGYQIACPAMLEDMEFTIVHELIHLELSSLPRSQASRSDEEHAVNQIADALLTLDREKPRK